MSACWRSFRSKIWYTSVDCMSKQNQENINLISTIAAIGAIGSLGSLQALGAAEEGAKEPSSAPILEEALSKTDPSSNSIPDEEDKDDGEESSTEDEDNFTEEEEEDNNADGLWDTDAPDDQQSILDAELFSASKIDYSPGKHEDDDEYSSESDKQSDESKQSPDTPETPAPEIPAPEIPAPENPVAPAPAPAPEIPVAPETSAQDTPGSTPLPVPDASVPPKEAIEEKEEKKKKKSKYSQPSFFVMNEKETTRYVRIMRYLKRNLNRVTMETAFITEMICRDCNKDFKMLPGKSAKENWKNLCADPVVLMEYLWKQSANHPMYIARRTSEADRSLNYFKYNAGAKRSELPPFSKVRCDQVAIAVSIWLTALFNGRPPGNLGTIGFQEKVVEQLSKKFLTNHASEFTVVYPSGISARNGYYFCDHVSPLLRFVPYGPETISTSVLESVPYIHTVMPGDHQAILDAESVETYPDISLDYITPEYEGLAKKVKASSCSFKEFVEKPNGQKYLDEVFILIHDYWESAEFLGWVYNLCGRNRLTVMLFRTLCQRTIMAPSEGTNYQSAHWVYGPPGTGKSTWGLLLSLLVGLDRMTEMGIDSNNFSNSAIVEKSLLILSDIVEISNKLYKILKPMLGRDPSKVEVKYEKNVITVTHFCQVLFIGNRKPSECGTLGNDPAVQDKTIPIFLNNVIKSNKMKGDLSSTMTGMVTDIFPWAILCNRGWLNEQIRARKINNTRYDMGLVPSTIFENFIEERLVYSVNPATDVIPNARSAASATKAFKPNNSPEQDALEYEKWKDKVGEMKSEKRALKMTNKICTAFAPKNAMRDDFEIWVKATGADDQLARVGGSLSKSDPFMADFPNLISSIISIKYGIKNYDKKFEGQNGFEGIHLISEMVKKPKDGKPAKVHEEFKRFDQPLRPEVEETLQVPYLDALAGVYPFMRKDDYMTQHMPNSSQLDMIKEDNAAEEFEAAKKGILLPRLTSSTKEPLVDSAIELEADTVKDLDLSSYDNFEDETPLPWEEMSYSQKLTIKQQREREREFALNNCSYIPYEPSKTPLTLSQDSAENKTLMQNFEEKVVSLATRFLSNP